MSKPLPGRPAHDLHLPTVGGGRWSLKDDDPRNFTLIVFYRGLHCPICKKNLRALQRQLDAFAERGVNVVAVSCDNRERAQETVQEWGLDQLTVAYDLRIDEARSWGLFISEPLDYEPAQFAEPGFFLIAADRTVYMASVQSMPFARPRYDDMLSAIDFVLEKDYPPRGTVD